MINCVECNVEIKNPTDRMKFCSAKCRSRYWVKHHKEQDRILKKTWRDRQVLKCRCCGNNIPLNIRKSGIVFCSDACRKRQIIINRKKYNKKVSNLFLKHKESIGCKVCGYNKCGAALDYHHKDPSIKERRVTAKMWYSNSDIIKKEIEKCTLLCSNCHDELHYKERGCSVNGSARNASNV